MSHLLRREYKYEWLFFCSFFCGSSFLQSSDDDDDEHEEEEEEEEEEEDDEDNEDLANMIAGDEEEKIHQNFLADLPKNVSAPFDELVALLDDLLQVVVVPGDLNMPVAYNSLVCKLGDWSKRYANDRERHVYENTESFHSIFGKEKCKKIAEIVVKLLAETLDQADNDNLKYLQDLVR